MSALVRRIAAHLRRRSNWTCDQCGRVNSDSVTSCYNCGA